MPIITVLLRPNGVLALVLASALATTTTSIVVLNNALDAVRAGEISASLARDHAADPQPIADVARVYPAPGALDVALGTVHDPDLRDRAAPQLHALATPRAPSSPTDLQSETAVRIVEGRPAVAAVPRPDGALDVIAIARNLSPIRALTLPRPVTRPGATTSPAWPDAETGPQTSSLLAAISPRPAERPNDLVVRVAARPDDIDVEVARGEAPGAIAGIGDLPRGGLFGGTANGECSTQLARAIPRRSGSASAGAAVMAAIGNGSGSNRDNRLVQEAVAGNVPSHLRALQPVLMRGTVGGRSVDITICVTPDYMAVGSDADNVRIPLGLPAALRLADAFDMMLPTTNMVDAIYTQADVRVAPSPMTPGSSMSSTNYFLRHDETLDGQFARAGARDGQLVAGHKKDLVLANRLSRNPGRVAIYGWHRTNGNPIQPLSTVHGEYYADYSHGIRLVSRTAYIDGRAVDLRDLLTDERYAQILNSDGALTGATVRLASL